MARQYFQKLPKEEARKWLELHEKEIPELEPEDEVRLMPTCIYYGESGVGFATMDYDPETLEPIKEVPTLTRVHKTDEVCELLVWNPKTFWRVFVWASFNWEVWVKLDKKYLPSKFW